MTDEQINKAIHTKILGFDYCLKHPECDPHQFCAYRESIPNYCNDLNAIAKVIEGIDYDSRFEDELLKVIRRDHFKDEFRQYSNGYITFLLINASARQRAEACLKAMGIQI